MRELGTLITVAASFLTAALLVLLVFAVRLVVGHRREARRLDRLIGGLGSKTGIRPRGGAWDEADLIRACLSNSLASARARTVRGTTMLAGVAPPIGIEGIDEQLGEYLEAVAELAISDSDVTEHAFRRLLLLIAQQAAEHRIGFMVEGGLGGHPAMPSDGGILIYHFGRDLAQQVGMVGARVIPKAWSLIDIELVSALEDLCRHDEERSPGVVEYVREHAWSE